MIIIAILAVAAAASPPDPPLVVRPDWVRRPSGGDVADAYPMGAARQGLSGRAEIDCLVASDGKVLDCKVLSEEPEGYGFGAGALRLARYFQMRPDSTLAESTRSHVRIPIRFVMYNGPIQRVTELEFPNWSSAPTFADVARAYPANGGGSTGVVTLQCRLDGGGAVKNTCITADETPKYKGFAQSARALAPLFHIDPKADVLKQGKTLWVKLTFRLAAPDSDDVKNRRIADPRWVALPTPIQLQQLFPAQALKKGLATGRGVASCEVTADGSMTNCKPPPGEPDGLGFSQAAVAIASTVRMSPWTTSGGPVDGARINLPIRFNLALEAPPPPAKP